MGEINYPHSHSGAIPPIAVVGHSLAEAWEKSLLALWEHGCRIRTEYDPKGPDGEWLFPPSADASAMITVMDPMTEPAIHRAFPGSLADLEEYRQEVVDGIKDHWVRNPDDPDDKRWEYTYHERLMKYTCGCRAAGGKGMFLDYAPVHPPKDQLQFIVDKLSQTPYSRRCNAITWQPWKDTDCSDPPCLQSIWCRILPDDNGIWHLNMNVRFRSRDAYDAAFMNMWAFICLQESLAKRIAEKAGREVRLGHYCDFSDSYHIYGKRHENFEQSFLKLIGDRSFEDRTWTREFAKPFFEEAKPRIVEKVAVQDAKYEIVESPS